MDGQNFQNGMNNDQNVQSTPVEPVVTPVSTPMTETVNVNTGSYSYQDNTAQYGASMYTQSAVVEEEQKTPGLAIGALVMGIVSIVLSCCCGSGIIFAIAGLIMAIVANKKQKSGVGTAALICSIVGIVFNAIMLIYYIVVYAAAVMAEM